MFCSAENKRTVVFSHMTTEMRKWFRLMNLFHSRKHIGLDYSSDLSCKKVSTDIKGAVNDWPVICGVVFTGTHKHKHRFGSV